MYLQGGALPVPQLCKILNGGGKGWVEKGGEKNTVFVSQIIFHYSCQCVWGEF